MNEINILELDNEKIIELSNKFGILKNISTPSQLSKGELLFEKIIQITEIRDYSSVDVIIVNLKNNDITIEEFEFYNFEKKDNLTYRLCVNNQLFIIKIEL